MSFYSCSHPACCVASGHDQSQSDKMMARQKKSPLYESSLDSGSPNTTSVSYTKLYKQLFKLQSGSFSTIKRSNRHCHLVTQWTLYLCYLFNIIWHITNLLLPINLQTDLQGIYYLRRNTQKYFSASIKNADGTCTHKLWCKSVRYPSIT